MLLLIDPFTGYKMKRVLVILAILAIGVFAVVKINATASCKKPAANLQKGARTKTGDTSTGVAVVELFTSEGCSSCPPADELLAQLDAEKMKNVYVLSFHVDYWNRLGWKDAYSSSSFTDRQRHYVERLQLESAYTPQAVVNGQEQFVGSDKTQLYNSVENALQQPAIGEIQLKPVWQGRTLSVLYSTPLIKDAIINIALVKNSAVSQVSRGENSGRQLHHINVVRDFVQATSLYTGTVSFSLPADFTKENYKVVAYVQRKADDKITAATEVMLNDAK